MTKKPFDYLSQPDSVLLLIPVFMLLDQLITYLAVRGGYAVEANPLMVGIAGTWQGLAIGFIMVVFMWLITGLMVKYDDLKSKKYSKIGWYFVLFMYACVVISNSVITFIP